MIRSILLHKSDRRRTDAILALRDESALANATTLADGSDGSPAVLTLTTPWPSTGESALWQLALSIAGSEPVMLDHLFAWVDEDSRAAALLAVKILAGLEVAA